MKRPIITVFSLILLSAGISFSQSVYLGAMGGPNRTYMWGPDFGELHPGINFMAGLSVEYAVSDHFSILSIPSYEVKGNAFDVTLTDEKGNSIGQTRIKNKLNYLTLPILAHGKFGDKTKVLVNGGPYVAYLLNAQFTGMGMDRKSSISNTDQFKRLDLGASFGIGVEFTLASQLNLSILIFNNVGLYDITHSNIFRTPVKNNATALLVGFNYALGDPLHQ